jgi:hypothetical protein
VPANDPAPHFDPLFCRLEAVVATHDYNNAGIAELVSAGARSAHAAGVPPEAMIRYLRQRVHGAPLAAVGDWFRTVLAERIISHATLAYFDAAPADASPQCPPSEA